MAANSLRKRESKKLMNSNSVAVDFSKIFVSLNKASAFECLLCYDITDDPKQCEKEHYYCRTCVDKYINENSKLKEEEQHSCPYCRDGCDEPLETFCDTVDKIDSLEIFCISTHELSERINCCQWTGAKRDGKKHFKRNCQFFPVSCPNKRCNQNVLRGQLAEHLETSCAYRKAECPHCSKLVFIGSFENHVVECEQKLKSIISCDCGCGQEYSKEEYETHVYSAIAGKGSVVESFVTQEQFSTVMQAMRDMKQAYSDKVNALQSEITAITTDNTRLYHQLESLELTVQRLCQSQQSSQRLQTSQSSERAASDTIPGYLLPQQFYNQSQSAVESVVGTEKVTDSLNCILPPALHTETQGSKTNQCENKKRTFDSWQNDFEITQDSDDRSDGMNNEQDKVQQDSMCDKELYQRSTPPLISGAISGVVTLESTTPLVKRSRTDVSIVSPNGSNKNCRNSFSSSSSSTSIHNGSSIVSQNSTASVHETLQTTAASQDYPTATHDTDTIVAKVDAWVAKYTADAEEKRKKEQQEAQQLSDKIGAMERELERRREVSYWTKRAEEEKEAVREKLRVASANLASSQQSLFQSFVPKEDSNHNKSAAFKENISAVQHITHSSNISNVEPLTANSSNTTSTTNPTSSTLKLAVRESLRNAWENPRTSKFLNAGLRRNGGVARSVTEFDSNANNNCNSVSDLCAFTHMHTSVCYCLACSQKRTFLSYSSKQQKHLN